MLTRRRFITNSCAFGASAVSAPMLVTDRQLPESNYRALVCINLAGGNDSFNMLVPSHAQQYQAYLRDRGNLALSKSNLLDLPSKNSLSEKFSLHTGMREIRDLYANGELAFIANVGVLDSPFDAKRLPSELLSHSGQISQWQAQAGYSKAAMKSGWGGRMADVLKKPSSNIEIPINISLSGPNIFQIGNQTLPFNYKFQDFDSCSSSRSIGVDLNFLTQQMAERAYHSKKAKKPLGELLLDQTICSAMNDLPDLSSNFASDPFSQQLCRVAEIIGSRQSLTSYRQIFYVSFDGWDHHHHLLANHAEMLPILSQGLLSFRNTLSTLGVFDNVATFTVSEFGRSLTSNGSGSNHGWGGHQMIMGGGLNGAEVYGSYPELSDSNPLNIGGGVYAPTTSYNQYFSEFARWMGVPLSKIGHVLPNLSNFSSPFSGTNNSIFFPNQ